MEQPLHTFDKIKVTMALAACLTAAGPIAPLVQAGPRADCDHRHRRHHAKAVIVVGPARAARHTVAVHGQPAGVLDLNLKPKATEVWVDGRFRGTADNFDGIPQKLLLAQGPHRLRLVTPDGVEVARDIRVQAGTEIKIGLVLR